MNTATPATEDTEIMDPTTAFLPIMLLLFIGMIFLSGRKQKQQMRETQKMQSELSDGDVVITTSGLRGTVVDASYEDTVDIEIAPGVVTTWVRGAVRETVNPDADAENNDEATDEAPVDGQPAADGRPSA
jgi:preprotein translocase subunit YajC